MKIIFIVLLIVFIILDYMIQKEGYMDTESQKEVMMQNVQAFPSTYSVDPLYESKFKPECCPNPYTSSTGCLCMDNQNYSLLKSRGGNNYHFKYATHKTPETEQFKDTCS